MGRLSGLLDHLGRLGPIFRRLETFLDYLVYHLGAVRASRKRVCRNGAVFRRLLQASAGVPPVAGAVPRGVPPQGRMQSNSERMAGCAAIASTEGGKSPIPKLGRKTIALRRVQRRWIEGAVLGASRYSRELGEGCQGV